MKSVLYCEIMKAENQLVIYDRFVPLDAMLTVSQGFNKMFEKTKELRKWWGFQENDL
jgi:hypothetical protein